MDNLTELEDDEMHMFIGATHLSDILIETNAPKIDFNILGDSPSAENSPNTLTKVIND